MGHRHRKNATPEDANDMCSAIRIENGRVFIINAGWRYLKDTVWRKRKTFEYIGAYGDA